MRTRSFLWSVLLAAMASPLIAAPGFEREVLPVLAKHCLPCHGGAVTKGGLDLRTPASLRSGGKNGPVIVAGKPEPSRLLERIADGSMPPEDKPRLTVDEQKLLTEWVRAEVGKAATAPATDHWAFRPLTTPTVPGVKTTVRVRTPVDSFVLAKLEARGLSFAPDAGRAALLRRVYFDLVGLPPGPEELDAFLADQSPDAYEKVVDRLLASPHFGERWGRHWLDVAGYADTIGTDNDVNGGKVREGMWRYRDYVIRSLNADKPFDRFLLEQLAGDQTFEWARDRSGPSDLALPFVAE